MLVKEENGRKYCLCSACNKPYSYKVGMDIYRPYMKVYCREHGKSYWPQKQKKKVNF